VLDHLLVSTPEEELVPVLVEARQDDRTADVSADVVKVRRRDGVRFPLRDLLRFTVPVVREEGTRVAGVEIAFAVELLAAAIGEGLKNRRSLGLLSAV
jgi:hypothetical protein